MKKEYGFSDAILGRLINALQESMIAGVDILDLFREMRVKPSDDDPHVLVLTEEYTKKVDEWHRQIEEDLKARKEEVDNNQSRNGVAIIGTGGPDVTKSGGYLPFDPSMLTEINKKIN